VSIEKPDYPELALEAGFDATVKVKVLIGKDGKVKKAIAVEGPDLFREACEAAAMASLFKPGLRGGRPVEVWIMIPFTFELRK
jgi:TonB family protein